MFLLLHFKHSRVSGDSSFGFFFISFFFQGGYLTKSRQPKKFLWAKALKGSRMVCISYIGISAGWAAGKIGVLFSGFCCVDRSIPDRALGDLFQIIRYHLISPAYPS